MLPLALLLLAIGVQAAGERASLGSTGGRHRARRRLDNSLEPWHADDEGLPLSEQALLSQQQQQEWDSVLGASVPPADGVPRRAVYGRQRELLRQAAAAFERENAIAAAAGRSHPAHDDTPPLPGGATDGSSHAAGDVGAWAHRGDAAAVLQELTPAAAPSAGSEEGRSSVRVAPRELDFMLPPLRRGELPARQATPPLSGLQRAATPQRRGTGVMQAVAPLAAPPPLERLHAAAARDAAAPGRADDDPARAQPRFVATGDALELLRSGDRVLLGAAPSLLSASPAESVDALHAGRAPQLGEARYATVAGGGGVSSGGGGAEMVEAAAALGADRGGGSRVVERSLSPLNRMFALVESERTGIAARRQAAVVRSGLASAADAACLVIDQRHALTALLLAILVPPAAHFYYGYVILGTIQLSLYALCLTPLCFACGWFFRPTPPRVAQKSVYDSFQPTIEHISERSRWLVALMFAAVVTFVVLFAWQVALVVRVATGDFVPANGCPAVPL